MKITGHDVIDLVAGHYGLSRGELTGPSKLYRICRPRQVAMLLMLRHCNHLSYPYIGRLVNRDHSTVHSGVKQIQALAAGDPKLNGDIEYLSRRLSSKAPDNLWQVRIIEAQRHLQALYMAMDEDAQRLS